MRFLLNFTTGLTWKIFESPAEGEDVIDFVARHLQKSAEMGDIDIYNINDGYTDVIDFETGKSYLVQFEAYTVTVVRSSFVEDEKDVIPQWAQKLYDRWFRRSGREK